MWQKDEHGRLIIHAGAWEPGVERERWILISDANGAPDYLLQQFETPHALLSLKSHVRSGRQISKDRFHSAPELPQNVREKLDKFLNQNCS